MVFKILKDIDMFKVPVNTFFTSRDRKLNKKKYDIFHGSKAGGCLTIIFVLVMLSLLQLEVAKMFSGDLDKTRDEKHTNHMNTPDNSIANIYNSSFMVSLQMLAIGDLSHLDIFNEGKIGINPNLLNTAII